MEENTSIPLSTKRLKTVLSDEEEEENDGKVSPKRLRPTTSSSEEQKGEELNSVSDVLEMSLHIDEEDSDDNGNELLSDTGPKGNDVGKNFYAQQKSESPKGAKSRKKMPNKKLVILRRQNKALRMEIKELGRKRDKDQKLFATTLMEAEAKIKTSKARAENELQRADKLQKMLDEIRNGSAAVCSGTCENLPEFKIESHDDGVISSSELSSSSVIVKEVQEPQNFSNEAPTILEETCEVPVSRSNKTNMTTTYQEEAVLESGTFVKEELGIGEPKLCKTCSKNTDVNSWLKAVKLLQKEVYELREKLKQYVEEKQTLEEKETEGKIAGGITTTASKAPHVYTNKQQSTAEETVANAEKAQSEAQNKQQMPSAYPAQSVQNQSEMPTTSLNASSTKNQKTTEVPQESIQPKTSNRNMVEEQHMVNAVRNQEGPETPQEKSCAVAANPVQSLPGKKDNNQQQQHCLQCGKQNHQQNTQQEDDSKKNARLMDIALNVARVQSQSKIEELERSLKVSKTKNSELSRKLDQFSTRNVDLWEKLQSEKVNNKTLVGIGEQTQNELMTVKKKLAGAEVILAAMKSQPPPPLQTTNSELLKVQNELKVVNENLLRTQAQLAVALARPPPVHSNLELKTTQCELKAVKEKLSISERNLAMLVTKPPPSLMMTPPPPLPFPGQNSIQNVSKAAECVKVISDLKAKVFGLTEAGMRAEMQMQAIKQRAEDAEYIVEQLRAEKLLLETQIMMEDQGDKESEETLKLQANLETMKAKAEEAERTQDSLNQQLKRAETKLKEMKENEEEKISKLQQFFFAVEKDNEKLKTEVRTLTSVNERLEAKLSHRLPPGKIKGSATYIALSEKREQMRADKLEEALKKMKMEKLSVAAELEKTRTELEAMLLTQKKTAEENEELRSLVNKHLEEINELGKSNVLHKAAHSSRVDTEISSETLEPGEYSESVRLRRNLPGYCHTRSLHVGNLDPRILTEKWLKNRFGRFGVILNVLIKKPVSSAPCAFVEYSDTASVVKAMEEIERENATLPKIKKTKVGFGMIRKTNMIWLDGMPEDMERSQLLREMGNPLQVIDIKVDKVLHQAIVTFNNIEAAAEALKALKNRNIFNQMDYSTQKLRAFFCNRINKSVETLAIMPHQYDPRSCRTLYVGNLDPEASENLLKERFEPFGVVLRVQIVKVRPNSIPYAFVEFADIDSAVTAMKEVNSDNLMFPKSEQRMVTFGKTAQWNTVWIGRIPGDMDQSKLVYEMKTCLNLPVTDAILDPFLHHALILLETKEAAAEAVETLKKLRFKNGWTSKIQVDYGSYELRAHFIDRMCKKQQDLA